MPNRLTATEKWNDPWFCNLPPMYKLFWIYLCDNCNYAGIWNVNWMMVKLYLGQDIFDPLVLGDRVKVLSDEKWYLRKFICFQQKVNKLKELNPENNAHKGIITILLKEGLVDPCQAPFEGLAWGPGKGKGKGSISKYKYTKYNNSDEPMTWNTL